MAVDPRRKALLEELAYGADPSVSAETRLRAAEQLTQLGHGAADDEELALRMRAAEMPEVEIDRETIDPQMAHVVAVLCGPVPGQPEFFDPMSPALIDLHFPGTAAAIRYHVERLGGAIAAKDGDPAGESTAGETVPGEEAPQTAPSEALDAEPVEETPTVSSPPAPTPTVKRVGREPWNGWPDSATA